MQGLALQNPSRLINEESSSDVALARRCFIIYLSNFTLLDSEMLKRRAISFWGQKSFVNINLSWRSFKKIIRNDLCSSFVVFCKRKLQIFL